MFSPRYLITSAHGVFCGLLFASPALILKPRDRWIGWNTAQCRLQLSCFVGLSRFLIRPQVACQQLASKAIGHCLRRLPTDFSPDIISSPCSARRSRAPPILVPVSPRAADLYGQDGGEKPLFGTGVNDRAQRYLAPAIVPSLVPVIGDTDV
ncbi:MAG: DUF4338 domain-containing protein [Aestuariivita sp.]|nr:DUF4338 domain-containing protein [Aestuariivita sp.]MCY4202416.1 DUF4338 domain-containing protein [Aestuariivita sp.]